MAASSAKRERDKDASAGIQRGIGDVRDLLVLSGDWTIKHVRNLEQQLRDIVGPNATARSSEMVIDAAGLKSLDTAGAWLLDKTARQLTAQGSSLSFSGLSRDHQELLAEVGRATEHERENVRRPNRLLGFVRGFGNTVDATARDLANLVSFLGLFVAAAFSAFTFQSKFRWTPFVHHLDHAGLRATPIIALICFLIGAVVMQQGAVQLSAYGAEPYAASMLGVLALREIGILLTAVMVAGRSASAFTAEIGSMKMREEIDAMRTLGIDPMQTLVVPRIMALLIALPLLTFVGNMMCLAGGAVVAVFYLDQPLVTFLERLQEAAEPRHFIAGMIKAPFAALVIGLVGCSEGMKVSGSAESLGQHVTNSVVKAIFLVIILGAMFAMFLVSMGV